MQQAVTVNHDIAEAAVQQAATVDHDIAEAEEAILKAAKHVKHVKNAKLMREYSNKKMEEALDDTNNDAPWSERRDCFVADFCQNMGLPHMGENQPGETYYFSPLGIYCFGVANVGKTVHDLRAYIFQEGQAKKGGDTVASLLYRHIKDCGLIDVSKGARKELTIVMDNCGGQNKNRMVLRLALLFVDLGFYKQVNCLFLVAGHTKTSCDRLFHVLKIAYRRQNVVAMKHLIEVLNTCQYVTAVQVNDGDIKHFEKFENTIYKGIATGTVNRSHIFWCVDTGKGILQVRDTVEDISEGSTQDLRLKGMSDEQRQLLVDNMNLEVVEPDGIKDIKKVEMFKKWRRYVPPGDVDDPIYADPGKSIIAEINKKRSDKARKRRKTVTTTVAL